MPENSVPVVAQKMLATKVGCARQTVNAVENQKMTWQLFMAILGAFNREESTRKMIDDILGFNEKLNIVLNEENYR